MSRVVADGEEPDFGTVEPVNKAEALERVGVADPTRAYVEALKPLAWRRWFGRCAVLHNAAGEPDQIYFWASRATDFAGISNFTDVGDVSTLANRRSSTTSATASRPRGSPTAKSPRDLTPQEAEEIRAFGHTE